VRCGLQNLQNLDSRRDDMAAKTKTAAAQAPKDKAKKTPRAAGAAAAKAKKPSALDAAAKVLQEEGKAMNCQEMIETMAAKGYWKSPGGKTPAATLYSAILRELKTKAKDARFQKVERGRFQLK
jgi:HB1, ASXL, restriction endonuclease HTH domain